MHVKKCPVCEAFCYSRVSRKGNSYWKCENGHAFYDDDGSLGKQMTDKKTDIKPLPDNQEKRCPVCCSPCERQISQKGNPYWVCKNNRKHVFYDNEGEIGRNMNEKPLSACPACGSSCVRILSRNNHYYWRCAMNSSHAFYDDNGKIGERMSKKGAFNVLPILVVCAFVCMLFLFLN